MGGAFNFGFGPCLDLVFEKSRFVEGDVGSEMMGPRW